jgi:hypothetical protein
MFWGLSSKSRSTIFGKCLLDINGIGDRTRKAFLEHLCSLLQKFNKKFEYHIV